MVVSKLRARGVDTDLLMREFDRVTPWKTRVIANRQQVVRFDDESTYPVDAANDRAMRRAISDRIQGFDAVIVSDYAKGVVTAEICQHLIAAASEHSVPVIVDPKGTDWSKYRGATLITPNRMEATQFCGFDVRSRDSLRRAGEMLCQQLELPWSIITLS